MVIHYWTALGLKSAAIERKIKEVYDEVISRQMINRWYTMFLDDRTDLNHDVCADLPSIIDEDS